MKWGYKLLNFFLVDIETYLDWMVSVPAPHGICSDFVSLVHNATGFEAFPSVHNRFSAFHTFITREHKCFPPILRMRLGMLHRADPFSFFVYPIENNPVVKQVLNEKEIWNHIKHLLCSEFPIDQLIKERCLCTYLKLVEYLLKVYEIWSIE